MEQHKSIIRQGMQDAVPIFIPAIPFTLILALAMIESGMPLWLGWSTSPVIYGGAAQLTLLTLLSDGAVAAITAALIVNARHLMYSAAMAPTFQQQPIWFRWFGPYLLVDQVFALAMLRINDEPHRFRQYYLTVGLTFWVLWLFSTAFAVLMGPVVPASWGLGFVVPLLFLSLLVMGVDRAPKAVAAMIAAAVAYLAADLPHRSGLLLGAGAGVVTGMLLEKLRR